MKNSKKKIKIKLELKEGRGKNGNILVIVKFDPKASNFFEKDFSWCPTLDELRLLEKALRVYG